MTHLRTTLALSSWLLLAGCNGVESITGPTASAIGITGAISNTNNRSTLLRVQVLLDGAVIGDRTTAPATVSLAASGIKHGAGRGRHVLSIKVAEQTAVSETYRTQLMIAILVEGDAARSTVELPDRIATLRAGESITYEFTI